MVGAHRAQHAELNQDLEVGVDSAQPHPVPMRPAVADPAQRSPYGTSATIAATRWVVPVWVQHTGDQPAPLSGLPGRTAGVAANSSPLEAPVRPGLAGVSPSGRLWAPAPVCAVDCNTGPTAQVDRLHACTLHAIWEARCRTVMAGEPAPVSRALWTDTPRTLARP